MFHSAAEVRFPGQCNLGQYGGLPSLLPPRSAVAGRGPVSLQLGFANAMGLPRLLDELSLKVSFTLGPVEKYLQLPIEGGDGGERGQECYVCATGSGNISVNLLLLLLLLLFPRLLPWSR